jgi:hypothetical protein
MNGPDDVMILGRDDIIAAYRLWISTYRLEPESVEDVLRRVSPTGQVDYATACADCFIAFALEAAREPIADRP